MAKCVTVTVTELPTVTPVEKYLPYAVIAGAILLAVLITKR